MWRNVCLAVVLSMCVGMPALAADKLSAPELIAMANGGGAGLPEAIRASFDAAGLKNGTAWTGKGPDFFFAVEMGAGAAPMLAIDDGAPVAMTRVGDSGLWYGAARVEPVGQLHAFHYVVGGKSFGGVLDMPALGPLHYPMPGVPKGTLSAKLVHTSKIYDGMTSEYWVYVPAQYDGKTAVPLMVYQDGEPYIRPGGNHQILEDLDNLTALGKIPVMISVFINPGFREPKPGERVPGPRTPAGTPQRIAMRSIEYDTVSDTYARFLRDELLPEALAKYNVRKDAYSRAITGSSSGGICAFNAAWQTPDQYSRVMSWIGSFTAIQWETQPGVTEGGQDYPEKVLREGHRNLRVWLQDGANDQENERFGSWPLANIRMANALKIRGYDFHLSFGKGTHNQSQGGAEFPESMIWLWRGYDPAKTEQTYEMEPEEKAKPLFRVGIVNR